MTNKAETAVRASFDEIFAMAKEERKLHPNPSHYLDVDAAIEALRVNVKSYLNAAASALMLGNTVEADHLRAQAAIVVAQACPVWEARLEAAKAERDRVYRGIQDAQRGSRDQMMGIYPRARGWEVSDADSALRLRLDALTPNLSNGDETAFNAVLDGMDAVLAAFRSTIGIARRESRLRVSEETARAAVSAVSAEAKAA